MPTPSEAPRGERVETRREGRKARQSPDHEPETGGESRSGKHNPLVDSSSLSRPTKSFQKPPSGGFCFLASSVKAVGELRIRKLAQHVIQGELGDSEGGKPAGFSRDHFDLVVQTLHNAT